MGGWAHSKLEGEEWSREEREMESQELLMEKNKHLSISVYLVQEWVADLLETMVAHCFEVLERLTMSGRYVRSNVKDELLTTPQSC